MPSWLGMHNVSQEHTTVTVSYSEVRQGEGVAAGVDGEHVNGNVRGRDGADMEANTGSRIHEQQGLPTQQVQFEYV